MAKEITWGNYLAVIGVLLVFYYLVVGFLYYREEITNLLRSKVMGGSADNAGNEASYSDQDPFNDLGDFVAQLNSTLESAGKNSSKEDLLGQVRPMLEAYSGLRISAYRVAVYNHIISKAKEICGVGISEEDLEQRG